jgi:hypothetical protein
MSSLREHVQSKYDVGVSGRRNIIERWDKIAEQNGIEAAQWVRFLRSLGIKAAHPDDGWVDRAENNVIFCYPQFNDKPKVSDLVVLGSHYNSKNRIVRITRAAKWGIVSRSTKYYFEQVSPTPKEEQDA